VLYVGKAVNLRNRVRQYFQKSSASEPRRNAMVSKIRDLELIVTDSEVEALILEMNLVNELRPKYNVSLKDDKSFPYIVVTNEPFPRVFATRRIIRDGSKYFGPYTDVKSMHSSLKMIREIFKVRSCNYLIDEEVIRRRQVRLCLDYHIKKCGGPCEGLLSRAIYAEMIGEVTQILKGKTHLLVSSLEERMAKASEELRFEEAAELRDRIAQLAVYNNRQKVVDPDLADRDLFAAALEGDDACAVVFRVRGGKIIGKQHFYMSVAWGKSEAEVLEQFIERYYFKAEDIPAEIFLETEIEGAGALIKWLSGRLGRDIHIVVPKIGDKAKLMAMCRSNAKFLLDVLKIQKKKYGEKVPPSLQALQRDLRLPRAPRRIECFDISNIQGADAAASMVVFADGRPKKSDYRKFEIRSVQGPDDFSSMREVLKRRYSRLLEEQGDLPDLIVVDGGKGQLSSALEVLDSLGIRKSSGLSVIGLAKRLEEVFVPGAGEPQSIPKTSAGLRLLQRVRDEAHRFAVEYHRKLRSKRTLQTELDLIAGVGKKRARELLELFGSVQGVKYATFEQLREVVGDKVASRIKDYFKEENAQLPSSG